MITISNKYLTLQSVTEEDAEFILELRTGQKGAFLNPTENNIQKQIDYIKKYKQKEANKEEYYFIIKLLDGEKIGTIRIYDIRGNSFCWGSWIIKEGTPSGYGGKSAFALYEFAFDYLGFEQSHFDVRKENKIVINFHKKCGAEIVDENNLDCFFIFTKEQYENARDNIYEKYHSPLDEVIIT